MYARNFSGATAQGPPRGNYGGHLFRSDCLQFGE